MGFVCLRFEYEFKAIEKKSLPFNNFYGTFNTSFILQKLERNHINK